MWTHITAQSVLTQVIKKVLKQNVHMCFYLWNTCLIRNWAKFHLSCVKRFGNRFCGGEGALPYKAKAPLAIFAQFFAPLTCIASNVGL